MKTERLAQVLILILIAGMAGAACGATACGVALLASAMSDPMRPT